VFEANLVYECLTSVPFSTAVATSFLNYYNDSIQFQSNLAYLKNPPASYQQPAVDFVEGLGQIQTAINQGTFKNQYEFEATLQALIYSIHDNHVNLVAGILGVSLLEPIMLLPLCRLMDSSFPKFTSPVSCVPKIARSMTYTI
jgi:hypothetical protein